MFWCSNCNGIGFGLIYLKSEDFSKRNHKRGLGRRVDFIKKINVYFAKFPKSWWLDCVLISLKKEDLFAKLSKIGGRTVGLQIDLSKTKISFLQNKRKKSQKLSARSFQRSQTWAAWPCSRPWIGGARTHFRVLGLEI